MAGADGIVKIPELAETYSVHISECWLFTVSESIFRLRE